MNTQSQHETMLRKPILMPPSMIKKVDSIAKSKKVSFAEVVREAVNAFGGKPTSEDEHVLDALADTMIKTTEDLIKRMDEIEKRLDSTCHLGGKIMGISEKVMDALRAGILLNEKVTTLLGKVERIDQDLRKMNDRLIRLETMVEVAKYQARLTDEPK